ncbi:tRNA-dihydrouridine synthase family protein [Candidatus Woesearchaeota archaeon]|nr:tRNA-dihydrouridine synthase family protein [Candidatus Woesearchaeota archaeon]
MDFKNKIILAPLAGVNNIAFRKICTDYGADIVYSPMIDARAMLMGNRKLFDFYDEKNLVVQFFGNDAEIIAQCAKLIEDKARAVDLNLGCPHSDVVKRKCGSYLMRYPKKISSIIKGLVRAVDLPVTVKIRAGYDRSHINAVKIAKLCEKEGITAIAVHGRARTVNYQHPVDYSIIKKVKEAVDVPVIGNGDIFSGEDAKRMFDSTGCDSVMIARGAMGNPFVFDEVKDYLKGRKSRNPSKKRMFSRFLVYCKRYNVEFKDIKAHAQWFTKGMKGGSRYRQLMNNAKSVDDLKEVYSGI